MDSANDPAQEEQQWIAAIARQDRAALKQLYDRYAPRIFRFVVRMIRDEARAQEVVNDVMLEIWKSAPRFEGRSAVSTWILGIARFRALNAMRGSQLATVGLDDSPEPVDLTTDLSQLKNRQQLRALLRNALAGLPVEQREVVELTFFHGYSYPEIAQILSCPENTVKTRMFHARSKLKPLLARQGITATDAGGIP